MFERLGQFVARYWLAVIVAWFVLLLLLRPPGPLSDALSSLGIDYRGAPRWADVTYDGDFAYLPEDKPSVRGERLLERAFPQRRARSQIVIVAARRQADEITSDVLRHDIVVANGISRWFHTIQAAIGLRQVAQLDRELADVDAAMVDAAMVDPADSIRRDRLVQQRRLMLDVVEEALDEALRLDRRITDLSSAAGDALPRLAEPYFDLARLHRLRGNAEKAAEFAEIAGFLDPSLKDSTEPALPVTGEDIPLLDVWDWHDAVFGGKLVSTEKDRQARLVVLQLSNEFMAVDNIRVLEFVERELRTALRQCDYREDSGLFVGISGSAAVGGDMLRAAADTISNTEWVTVVLVVLILGLVYRSPLLILVPMLTIGVSLFAALSIVAALTQLHHAPGMGWWDLKVFTTTRIFIVVILLGAGTDYCLFLISRYREELESGLEPSRASSSSVAGVGDALVASALTTILGLSMMYFASFGKFKHSGPVIGICLAVTLLACLTLTPAMLRACGRAAFWPARIGGDGRTTIRRWAIWDWIARSIIAHPAAIMITVLLLLLPLTVFGFVAGDRVTYDFLNALPPERPSRIGSAVLKQHFPVGESGPITVLVSKPGADFETVEGYSKLLELCNVLYVDGVRSVRSIADPLGEFPPPRAGDKQFPSIVSPGGRTLHFLRAHPRIRSLFVSPSGPLKGQVARIELITDTDPFSPGAARLVETIQRMLVEVGREDEDWRDAQFALAGVTAGIRDLRDVTRSDTRRIQILVVLAVLGVLLAILRRPVICVYLIVTVLVSYFFTLGATQWFFGLLHGPGYAGLDWKTPVFLFVILVAVGQDYNVYLATRVFEEQRRWGATEGLRRAIVHTGGIITSCGVIMAGTFISMTAGTWGDLPGLGRFMPRQGALQGIVELGFALALGILIDTLIVRTVLAPAFIALLDRARGARPPSPDADRNAG